MNTAIKYILLVIFCVMGFGALASNDDLYKGLTDSEQFRTFPYIDKAFRLENDKQYHDALLEVQHALKVVPQHVPYIQYAYRLSILDQRPISELTALILQMPQAMQHQYMFELQMKASETAQLYSSSEVDEIAKYLSKAQLHQWYLHHLYQIEHTKGSAVALDWSLSQSNQYKDVKALRYEAYELIQTSQYQDSIKKLEVIKNNNDANSKDMAYLAFAYLSIGEETKGLELIETVSDQKTQQQIYSNYVDTLMGNYQLGDAKRVLNLSIAQGWLTAEQKKQRDYFNTLAKQDLKLLEDESNRASPCLTQSQQFYSTGDIAQSKKLFANCSSSNTPNLWLTLAVQLNEYSKIEKVSFDDEQFESKRQAILIQHFTENQQRQKIVDLLHHKQINNQQTRILASAYIQLSLYQSASEIMFALYQQTGKIKDLDSATYALSQTKNHDNSLAQMLNYGISKSQQNFFSNDHLISRMADVAYDHIELFTIDNINLLNQYLSENAKISATSWVEQNQCDALLQDDDTSQSQAYKMRAQSYCLAKNNPIAAAHLYKKSLTQSSPQAEKLIVAQWFAQEKQYQESYPYWDGVNINDLNEYQQFLYVSTLSAVGQFEEANQSWKAAHFDKENEQWWLLGATVSDELNQPLISEQRLAQGIKYSQSPTLVRDLANRYQQQNETKKISKLTREVVEIDKTGDMSSSFAYVIAQSDPQNAEQLFANAYQYETYQSDPILVSEYARVLSENNKEAKAETLYETAIEQVYAIEPQTAQTQSQLEYLQLAHKNMDLGWKFTVAGWLGRSDVQNIPGYSSKSGNFFLYEEARYIFSDPWIPRTSFSIAGLQSGDLGGDSDDSFNSEIDLGYQFQLFENHNSYLKLGLKQSISGDDFTRPYLRLSSDVFSKDKWTKAWQKDNDYWLYQNLYLDGLLYFNSDDTYSLYARYEVGETFKVIEDHKQRVTPYGFTQWSRSEIDRTTQDELLIGLGASWSWEWYQTRYDGYKVDSEVSIEWQHVIESKGLQDTENSALLRFSSYF